MLRNKQIIFASLFYLIAFVMDTVVTSHGVASGRGSEGDPLVLFLWSIFGFDSLFLKIIYVTSVFAISHLLYKKLSRFLGLWIPFSLGIGHLLGFSTWLPLYFNGFTWIAELNRAYGTYGIFVVAPILGFFLAVLSRRGKTSFRPINTS